MRVIIAGSRTVADYWLVRAAVEAALAEWADAGAVAEVVSGCNGRRDAAGRVVSGTDLLGEAWASAHAIPVKRFPADWNKHGKAAGPIRNREMAAHATHLVAVWVGESRGTKNMIEEMEKLGKPVHVVRIAAARS